MTENQPGFIYWKAIEPFWEKISIYDGPEKFLHQLSAVPEGIRHLFCTHLCQSEVSNGGFYQFYSNSTGILAPEAVDGFLALGLVETAKIVRNTMAYFGEPFPRDREIRTSILKHLGGSKRAEWDPFYSIDNDFYTSLRLPVSYELTADDFARSFS